jgi:hypothetical protein
MQRAVENREQNKVASKVIQRTQDQSDQLDSENRENERAERTREQPFAASKMIQRTGWKSEQIRVENRYIKRARSDLPPS